MASDSSDVRSGRQFVETDDVGEDHGDVLVVLGDGLLAVAVARHHLLGHQGQQQAVVLAPLLVEEVLLDGEVAAHVVERHGQIAEFVAGRHGDGNAVVARADLLGAALEPADRADEQPRQQHRRDADHEDDRHRRQHQPPGERRHRGEGLRGVDLGDDGPSQPGDVGGRIGLQRLVAEVVVGDQRAALALLRQLGRHSWRRAAPASCRAGGWRPRRRRAACPPLRRRVDRPWGPR